MSTGMGEAICPLCDGQMLTSFGTADIDWASGICIECGFCYWTELGVLDLDQVNAEREAQDLEPLKQLKIYLKALDQLRWEHGLEPLRDVPENWRKTLERIKEEVVPEDPTKRE